MVAQVYGQEGDEEVAGEPPATVQAAKRPDARAAEDAAPRNPRWSGRSGRTPGHDLVQLRSVDALHLRRLVAKPEPENNSPERGQRRQHPQRPRPAFLNKCILISF